MKYIERKNEVEITEVGDFDIVKIFECGQCFRWNMDESGAYVGVAKGRAARVRRVGESIFISGSSEDFETIWRDYFDLERDYAEIRQRLCIDEFMKRATEFGAGIRILRQDKWEALCSFIISQNNNISRIKKIVDALCRYYGDKLEFEGEEHYTFPAAEKLAVLNVNDLATIRCGYRAEYIISAARDVSARKINLDTLAGCPPPAACLALKKLHGIGDKVADCMALFGLNMLDVFPTDVWIKRAVAKHYGSRFNPNIFTPYAGIAQQYIFYYARQSG